MTVEADAAPVQSALLTRSAAVTLASIQVVDAAVWSVTFAAYWIGVGPSRSPLALLALIPVVIHLTTAAGLLADPRPGLVAQRIVATIGLIRIPFGTISSIATLGTIRDRAMNRRRAIMIISGSLLWQALVLGFVMPNFLEAAQISRDVRTMSDMRAMGSALEEFAEQHKKYPDASDVETAARALPRSSFKRVDGWGRPYLLLSSGENYVIASAGRDGKFERTDLDWYIGKDSKMHDGKRGDIVFSNGMFIRYRSPGPCRCD